MDFSPVAVTGKVSRDKVSRGSKSEHRAVVLKTGAGETYVLRRHGGPAFADADLEKLVGCSISAEGLAASGTLIMRKWRVVE